jgi:putative hydrolase of the HAD superfamily
MAIRRIFLDSGMVLVHPRSGHWFHTTAYLAACARLSLPEVTARQKLNEKAAHEHLAAHPSVRDEAEETELFLGYYSRLFAGVEGKDNRDFIAMCATNKATDLDEQVVYGDVPASLERLSRSFKLGVISDAWPSLEKAYRKNGLRRHFDPFVVSSLHGCTKEGRRLFEIALSLVEEGPGECLFVDDSPANCGRARKLGLEVLVLNRNRYQAQKDGFPTVADMAGLERFVGLPARASAPP